MQYLKYLSYILLLCAVSHSTLQAQTRYLQASLHTGSIIKHNTDITFDTQTPSYGFELGMYWQTQGSQKWQETQSFPRFHLTASYQDLGQKDIVGSAIMLAGGVEVPLFRKASSAFHFGVGTGFAYLTRPYDRITNPTNNAIGSHINNTVTVKWDYERRFRQDAIIHFGLKLFHYSNGARKLPNLGLNIPSLYLAISPYKGSYEEDFFEKQKRSKSPKQKFGLAVHTHYAQVEIRVPGGPSYPVYIVGADGYFSPNGNHRFSLGYQYEYNTSIEAFGLDTGDFLDDTEARIGSTRHSFTLGDEFLFGPWAIQLKLGFYTNRQRAFLVPRPFYFQISPRYYFNSKREGYPKVYTSIQLKSHLFVAEHISFGLGLVF